MQHTLSGCKITNYFSIIAIIIIVFHSAVPFFLSFFYQLQRCLLSI